MDTTPAHSPNGTQLNDRFLWFDGDSTIKPQDVIKLITKGAPVEGLFVTELSDEIRQYNQLVSSPQRINVKSTSNKSDLSWNLPDPYRSLNPWEYIATALNNRLVEEGFLTDDGLTPEGEKRVDRIAEEIRIYKLMGLANFLRAIIYVINTLREKNLVWGVGRGSSVSSYVLFVLGVHDVDSVMYDLDIDEFLHVTI